MPEKENRRHLNELFDFALIAIFCREHGIKKLSVFGSMAKGTYRPDSDVDLLIEFVADTRIGLFGITRLEMELSEVMGRKVDLVTVGGLKELIKDTVLSEAEVLYAA